MIQMGEDQVCNQTGQGLGGWSKNGFCDEWVWSAFPRKRWGQPLGLWLLQTPKQPRPTFVFKIGWLFPQNLTAQDHIFKMALPSDD